MVSYQKILYPKKFKEIEVPTESIYNLIPSSPKLQRRSPLYQSIYSSLTKQLYDSGRKSHQTMGYAKTPRQDPHEYLKKHTREKLMKTETIPFSCLNKDHKRPPVPKSTEAPIILSESHSKDFIHINKVNVLRKPAMRPPRKLIDNRRGDSFFLEFSGLVPKFSMKKEFGETPKYLVQRRNELGYANDVFMKSNEGTKLIKLSEEERNDLLEGLRDNWEELNSRYLTLPVMIDTKSLKTRKLELEKKLDLLEHDIYFLERNRDNDIYILPE